jgi:hypothetical protein
LAAAVFAVSCGGRVSALSAIEGPGDAEVTEDAAATIDAPAPIDVEAPGRRCGSADCAGDQFCMLDLTCHATGGTCAPRPGACPAIYAPVCGVDGKVYPSRCDANAIGVDVPEVGDCSPPAGMVACGGVFCDAATSFCIESGNDVGGPGEPCAFYTCASLPASCKGATTCACFGGAPNGCGAKCAFDGHGFQVLCPGG